MDMRGGLRPSGLDATGEIHPAATLGPAFPRLAFRDSEYLTFEQSEAKSGRRVCAAEEGNPSLASYELVGYCEGQGASYAYGYPGEQVGRPPSRSLQQNSHDPFEDVWAEFCRPASREADRASKPEAAFAFDCSADSVWGDFYRQAEQAAQPTNSICSPQLGRNEDLFGRSWEQSPRAPAASPNSYPSIPAGSGPVGRSLGPDDRSEIFSPGPDAPDSRGIMETYGVAAPGNRLAAGADPCTLAPAASPDPSSSPALEIPPFSYPSYSAVSPARPESCGVGSCGSKDIQVEPGTASLGPGKSTLESGELPNNPSAGDVILPCLSMVKRKESEPTCFKVNLWLQNIICFCGISL